MKPFANRLTLAMVALSLSFGCAKHDSMTIADAPKADSGMAMENMNPAADTILPEGNIQVVAEVTEKGEPKTLGFKFDVAVLDRFPKEMNPNSMSFDINGNGKIEMDLKQNPPLVEMLGDYSTRIEVPEALKAIKDFPFTFLMFNWNPMGHPPMGWMTPHADFHFYMVPQADVDAITAGPIPHVISQESYDKALKAVPAKYMAKGFVNTEPPSTVGGMGNHLIDPMSPEIVDPQKNPMTYTWIFGTYEGKVTFWEPMISGSFLSSKQDAVVDIKLPDAYEKAGWYPTKYAIRHAADGTCTVSLESWVMRKAG